MKYQNLIFAKWNWKKSSCLFWSFCDPMDCSPPGSSVHGIPPDKNIGVGCHFLLWGIFSTQGSSLHLLHLLQLLHVLQMIQWSSNLHIFIMSNFRYLFLCVRANRVLYLWILQLSCPFFYWAAGQFLGNPVFGVTLQGSYMEVSLY